MGRNTKKYSSTQERRLAASIGGTTQPASGALNIASLKADVKATDSRDWKILIDGKTTMCDTHQEGVRSKSIKKDWMNVVEQQAREGGYDFGVLAFSFDNRKDYYVVKDIDFNNMYQAVRDYEKLTQSLQTEINRLNEKLAALQNTNTKPKYFNIDLTEGTDNAEE